MKSILVIFLLITTVCFSQNQQKIIISYNETINLGKIENETNFIVSTNENTFELKGNQINTYKFSKPGAYFIKINQQKINHDDDCSAFQLPNEIEVQVSPIKMIFDDNKIKLSKPIQKNIDTQGIILSIPVSIKCYKQEKAKIDFSTVKVAGIGSTIYANLINSDSELSKGNYIFQYELSGKVIQNSFLMFDFINCNGQIQSVSLKNPIAN